MRILRSRGTSHGKFLETTEIVREQAATQLRKTSFSRRRCSTRGNTQPQFNRDALFYRRPSLAGPLAKMSPMSRPFLFSLKTSRILQNWTFASLKHFKANSAKRMKRASVQPHMTPSSFTNTFLDKYLPINTLVAFLIILSTCWCKTEHAVYWHC